LSKIIYDAENIVKDNLFDEVLARYSKEIASYIIQNNRHIIITDVQQLDKLIDEALITNNNKALHLGVINKDIIFKIKNSIINLPKNKCNYLKDSNYDLVINQSEIRHLKADKNRLSNDEIHEYVKRLASIISDFDVVYYSKQKEEGLRFEKKFNDGSYFSVILVSNKKYTFTVKTIYMKKFYLKLKKRNISPPTNSSSELLDRTPKASGLSVSFSNNNIT